MATGSLSSTWLAPAHAGQLDHHQAHRAAAQDAHRVPMADVGPVNAMDGAGQRLGHGPIFQGDGGEQAIALLLLDHAGLGKAAVQVHAIGLKPGAQLLFADAAVVALTAVHVGVHGDVVPQGQGVHPGAQGLHHAGELVPQHHGGLYVGRALSTVVDVYVGAAHAAGGHPHPDAAWTGLLIRQGPDLKGLVS